MNWKNDRVVDAGSIPALPRWGSSITPFERTRTPDAPAPLWRGIRQRGPPCGERVRGEGVYGPVAQSVERRVRNAKAAGSTPARSTQGSAMLPQASECPVGFGRPATGRGGRLRVGSPLRRRQGSGPAGTEPRAGGMDAEPSAPPGTDCGAAWSAHLTGGQGVAGSNPVNPTGRMASNSIRCIVDTLRRRDGGTLPTKAGRRAWNPGLYGSGGSRRSTADSDDGSNW